MSYKRWTYTQLDKELAGELSAECGLDPLLCLMLTGRGITDAQAAMEFLVGNELMSDPFSYTDMDAAVERIQRAVDEGESIAVYGDYDADGVTATVLLYSYLRSKGARVQYRLPLREGEGYGLHCGSIDELSQDGVQLIITVDNGISAVEEVDYAASCGIDVVVTDHHQPPEELPRAVAVVDPHRKDCTGDFKDLAGVGVAFQLVCALEGDPDRVLEEYGDLVALGTLADVMPLHGDNRVLVRRGLQRINRSDCRLGLRRLREFGGTEKALNASGVAFTLAPRINAAGRMGDPHKAAALLLSESEEEATALANEIHLLNNDRQTTEAQILKELLQSLQHNDDILSQRILVVWGKRWHQGVLGIIAARLMERFGKPCIVLSVDDGIARGSGRSIKGFSLYEALHACESCLLGYGGHEQAAGLTIEEARIPEFCRLINDYAKQIAPTMPVAELNLDCRLRPGQITPDMLAVLSALEPVGAGNPRPIFGLVRMKLERVDAVGGGKHLRLTLSRDGNTITAMKFSTTPEEFSYGVGEIVDLAVILDRSDYRGQVGVTIVVRDIRHTDLPQEELLEALATCENVLRREMREDVVMPTRDSLARVYRYLKQRPFYGPQEVLCYRLKTETVSCVDVLLACRILREAGLIEWHNEGDNVSIAVRETSGKADLNETETARFLLAKEG
ncbi:MAG: single-stranded-DNA-specific exonuclease RecJ [Clostridia bacterium]|nr:single-stranded-DNA-specific exonuclease RecJ [Clostridia bacterium]